MQSRMRRIYFTLFLLFVIIEVLIALWIHDSFVRPYLGDVLAVIVVYFLTRTVFPGKYRLLPLYVFLFAVGVEALQAVQLSDQLGIQNQVLRAVIGSVFDWKDILCYGTGSLFLGIWEYIRMKIGI
jgi:hypothetical protein